METLPGARQLRILGLCLVVSLLIACDQLSPTILSFTANPTSVEIGDEVTLSWVAIGPENLELTLTPGDVPLSAIGSYTVTPTQTTTYTLTTTSEDGATSKEVTVSVTNVGQPPAGPVCDAALIPDDGLRSVIRETLAIASGTSLCRDDLLNLTELFASRGIADLTGLEYATNLTTLSLDFNDSIRDLSPLANLTGLESLGLSDNLITDISALANLTNLRGLRLDGNSLSDISVLAGLPNLVGLGLSETGISDISVLTNLSDLEFLSLDFNPIADFSVLAGLNKLTELSLTKTGISDISVLAGLSKLEDIALNSNEIADLSALANLTELRSLDLRDNKIADISPLVSNAGIASGDQITLQDNLLDLSPGSHDRRDIETLEARGVSVFFAT